LAVVLQTPRDPQSAVYMSHQSLAAALEQLGHSVEIVAPGDLAGSRRTGGRWVPLVYPFTVAWWLERRRRDFDLVLFHSYAGWLAAWLRGARRSLVMFHGVEPLYHRELTKEAAVNGQPLSWRYRLLQEWLMPFMLRTACRSADAVVCLNRAEAEFLASRKWVPSDRVRIAAHGVPPVFFGPARGNRTIRTLLFVGQWLPMKGIRYLREAAVVLLRDEPSMRLVCAGTLAAEQVVLAGFPHQLYPQINVIPRIDEVALAALYREADVFVFPSLYEAFSRAIAEAMASGLPIVTTDVGVAADALRDRESAIVVPKRNAAAIIAAVRRLQADPTLASRLGTAAAAAAAQYRAAEVDARTIAMILGEAGVAP
jgi:glycosyltransferase involved in cell wall biosynthesis